VPVKSLSVVGTQINTAGFWIKYETAWHVNYIIL